MRVMISQPMRGKTTEQIRAERAELIAKLEAVGHDVVDTIFTGIYPRKARPAVWNLGKALMELSQCDALVMMPGWEGADGCVVELTTAYRYGIPVWYAADPASWEFPAASQVADRIRLRADATCGKALPDKTEAALAALIETNFSEFAVYCGRVQDARDVLDALKRYPDAAGISRTGAIHGEADGAADDENEADDRPRDPFRDGYWGS